MAAPAVLGLGGAAAVNGRIVGPVAATFALIAAWEVTRPLRWTNLPLGCWLVLAPLPLAYDSAAAIANDLLCGAALIGFSFVKGRTGKPFGGGWRAVWGGKEAE